jgi:hypothetical protein
MFLQRLVVEILVFGFRSECQECRTVLWGTVAVWQYIEGKRLASQPRNDHPNAPTDWFPILKGKLRALIVEKIVIAGDILMTCPRE